MAHLEKSRKFNGVEGPLLTIVMDGVGLAPDNGANAVAAAHTPTLDYLMANYPMVAIRAHGTAVGLPSDDDMGNSEVGHNALGSGQVFAQGAKLVSQSIETGKLFTSGTWLELVNGVKTNGSTLHFMGLFSDGNVHSHIDHLKALIENAKASGVKRVRIHILLDGRDVGETSALDYVCPFEEYLDTLRSDDFDIAIASGGGRMQITMDRYEANWSMVEAGWKTHVLASVRCNCLLCGCKLSSLAKNVSFPACLNHSPVCFVSVHSYLHSAAAACDSDIKAIGTEIGKELLEGTNVIKRTCLTNVSTVQKNMNSYLTNAGVLRFLNKRLKVINVRVNVSVGEKAEEMKGAVIILYAVNEKIPCLGRKYRTVFDRLRNKLCALRKNLA